MHLPGDLILKKLQLPTLCYEPHCPSAKLDMPKPFIFNYSAPLRRVVDPSTGLPAGVSGTPSAGSVPKFIPKSPIPSESGQNSPQNEKVFQEYTRLTHFKARVQTTDEGGHPRACRISMFVCSWIHQPSHLLFGHVEDLSTGYTCPSPHHS
jgi:hypothetical protein